MPSVTVAAGTRWSQAAFPVKIMEICVAGGLLFFFFVHHFHGVR
jgi:hypothetical protein